MGGLKFSMKMHEKCDFNEKERVKETYLSQKIKTLERFEVENNKKCFKVDWSRKIEKGVFEKV